MSEPVVFPVQDHPGQYIFWCAGCECAHGIDSTWSFNGDLVRPTITPSVLSQGEVRCHSFVTDGKIRYLPDSEHALAGQTVDMVRPPWE
jgi:hypothetical protein